MKDNQVIIIVVLAIGVILLIIWLNNCEKYSSHSFPGPQVDRYSEHSLHVGTGEYDWSKVSGYEKCVKSLIEKQYLTFKEADPICTPLLSDPEAESFPF